MSSNSDFFFYYTAFRHQSPEITIITNLVLWCPSGFLAKDLSQIFIIELTNVVDVTFIVNIILCKVLPKQLEYTLLYKLC